MKRIIIMLLSLGVFASGPAFSRDKTDTIWVVNGNQITGEIKKLEHGLLTLKTDYYLRARIMMLMMRLQISPFPTMAIILLEFASSPTMLALQSIFTG